MKTPEGKRWRAWVVRHLPEALVVYPFECITSLVAGIMGFALLSGSFRPDSLFAILPTLVVLIYGAAALVGSITTAHGIRRDNSFVIALGLRLLGMVLGVYGVALIFYAGWRSAGFAAVFFIAKGLVALLRSLYLRAATDVRRDLAKEGL